MREQYSFDEFVWDASLPALYYKDELIEEAGKRSLQVLGVFLRAPNQLISHQRVLDEVWGEDNVTVTPDNVHQTISQLRKIIRARVPDADYFKSKKGIGYTFACPVDVQRVEDGPAIPNSSTSGRSRRWMPFLLAIGILVVGACALAVWRPWDRTEAEIRKLITESQSFESLALYEDPTAYNEKDLDKYWTPEADSPPNGDHARIRANWQGMLSKGQHYGPESKCERLDFEWIKLNAAGDFATVRTLEKWSVAIYDNAGKFLANKTIGPYFVDYSVKKAGDRWLIEKSTTGRVIRPKPQVADIIPVSTPKPGEPFTVRLDGSDFQPDAVYLEIFGPGCPDTNPCSVTNPTLREHATVTDKILDNVKLMLSPGTFRVIVRNGDSSPSDPLTLTVP